MNTDKHVNFVLDVIYYSDIKEDNNNRKKTMFKAYTSESTEEKEEKKPIVTTNNNNANGKYNKLELSLNRISFHRKYLA